MPYPISMLTNFKIMLLYDAQKNGHLISQLYPCMHIYRYMIILLTSILLFNISSFMISLNCFISFVVNVNSRSNTIYFMNVSRKTPQSHPLSYPNISKKRAKIQKCSHKKPFLAPKRGHLCTATKRPKIIFLPNLLFYNIQPNLSIKEHRDLKDMTKKAFLAQKVKNTPL